MPGRGPLPLPTAVKRLKGTLRPGRVAAAEAPTLALPRVIRPPAWLTPGAAATFARLVATLKHMGVLGRQDLDLVALLASQLDLYEACSLALNGKPALTFVVLDGDGNPKGVQPWPELKIRAAALVEIRRLAEHFGLSPASRGRVSSIGIPDSADDPFAEFIGPQLAVSNE